MGEWEPDPRLPPYKGPYPIRDLQQARVILIEELKQTGRDVLEKIKPKIGIPSRYGNPMPLLPPVRPMIPELPGTSGTDSGASKTNLLNGLQRTAASATVTSGSEAEQVSGIQTTAERMVTIKRKAPPPSDEAGLSKVGKFGAVDCGEVWPQAEETRAIPTLLQYKCDFCTFQSPSRPLTESHLQQARHYTASQYQAVKTDHNIKLIAVSEKLAIKNKHGKNETLAVVCPKCYDLFDDIFMCGLHYKCTHGGESSVYSVCPVIHQSMAMVAPDYTCLKCNEVFSSNKHITSHWETEPDHHPISKKKPPVAFALYSCSYCDKIFYENFNSCKAHVISAHGSNRTSYALKVKFIMKPMRPEELPPEVDKPNVDGISKDIEGLKKMKIHFKNMGGTKDKVKSINRLIKNLEWSQGSPQS